jgi:hypothetical protein
MKPKNFDDFLNDWFMKDYHGTDDNAPEAFDDWMSNLEQHSLLALADLAIREAEIRGIQRGGEIATQAIHTALNA